MEMSCYYLSNLFNDSVMTFQKCKNINNVSSRTYFQYFMTIWCVINDFKNIAVVR